MERTEITITIPTELMHQMEKIRGVDWFKVTEDAFRKVVEAEASGSPVEKDENVMFCGFCQSANTLRPELGTGW